MILTCRKASEELDLYIGQPSSNYPDLAPEMPKYYCPVEMFYVGFLVLKRYD